MPDETFHHVFQFEDALVTAAVAAFNADEILGPGSTFGPRALTALPKSRLDVEATAFAKASDQQIFARGRYWDAHYAGQLTVTVITQRAASPSPTHAARVGRARYLLSPFAAIFNDSSLPDHEVLAIEETASAYEFDESTDTDRTELSFTLQLGLIASTLEYPVVVDDPPPGGGGGGVEV